uniref:TRASH domain-containing protein n=1 Tax=Thermosporothrix sp. COM3 TaxID=2490863 RepID=A0A455SIC8_9CHLR|nr:hypothetical protein KTC_14230 [Thermosporothrix sp. COM3]
MSDERQQATCLPVSISEKAEQAERRKTPLFERLSCAMPSTGRIENIGAIIGALAQLLTASRQFVQSLSWLGDAMQALPTKVVVVERVRDPVCGKRVDPHTTRLTIEHQGRIEFFCSEQCRDLFTETAPQAE